MEAFGDCVVAITYRSMRNHWYKLGPPKDGLTDRPSYSRLIVISCSSSWYFPELWAKLATWRPHFGIKHHYLPASNRKQIFSTSFGRVKLSVSGWFLVGGFKRVLFSLVLGWLVDLLFFHGLKLPTRNWILFTSSFFSFARTSSINQLCEKHE